MAESFGMLRLMAEGRTHWQTHLPALFEKLKAAGTLEAKLREAAELTLAEMAELEAAGMTAAEAWPEVRENHLILDPDDVPPDVAAM